MSDINVVLAEQTFVVISQAPDEVNIIDGISTIELTATLSSASPELVAYVDQSRTYLEGMRSTLDVDFAILLDYLENGNQNQTLHSALAGLSNDDHLQYFNQIRGDARYYTQGQIDTAIAGIVSDHGELTGLDDDDHAQYHTDARGDARYLKLTGNESIGGIKTFTDNLVVSTVSGATLNITSGGNNTSYLNLRDTSQIQGQLIGLDDRVLLRRPDAVSGNNDLTLWETYANFSKPVRVPDPIGAEYVMPRSYADARYLNLAGGTIDGQIAFAGTNGDNFIDGPTNFLRIQRSGVSENNYIQLYDEYTITNKRIVGVDGFSSTHFMTKSYIDGLDTANVKLTGPQTIAGAKSFVDDIAIGNGTNTNSTPYLTLNSGSSGNPAISFKRESTQVASIVGLSNRLELSHGASRLEIYGTANAAVFNTVARASTPVGSTDLTTKAYVDDNFVDLTTDQSVIGRKTFESVLVQRDVGQHTSLTIVGNTDKEAALILRRDDDNESALYSLSYATILRRWHSGVAPQTNSELKIYNDYFSFNKVVNGVTPTASAHLTTKAYVDGFTPLHAPANGNEMFGINDNTSIIFGNSNTSSIMRFRVGGTQNGYILGHPSGITLLHNHSGAGTDSSLSLTDGVATFNTVVVGVTPTAAGHLTRKDYVDDKIAAAVFSSGGGGVTDHSLLTSLGDDDHPQYLTAGRGDARYLNSTGGVLTGTTEILGDLKLKAPVASVPQVVLSIDTFTCGQVIGYDSRIELNRASGIHFRLFDAHSEISVPLRAPHTLGTDHTQAVTTRSYVDAADALKLDKTGGTMTARLTIEHSSAELRLNGTGGTTPRIYFHRDGVNAGTLYGYEQRIEMIYSDTAFRLYDTYAQVTKQLLGVAATDSTGLVTKAQMEAADALKLDKTGGTLTGSINIQATYPKLIISALATGFPALTFEHEGEEKLRLYTDPTYGTVRLQAKTGTTLENEFQIQTGKSHTPRAITCDTLTLSGASETTLTTKSYVDAFLPKTGGTITGDVTLDQAGSPNIVLKIDGVVSGGIAGFAGRIEMNNGNTNIRVHDDYLSVSHELRGVPAINAASFVTKAQMEAADAQITAQVGTSIEATFTSTPTWQIDHALPNTPHVTVMDAAGRALLCAIEHVSSTRVLVTHNSPQSGTMRVS